VRDHLPFRAAGVIEVELLQALAGREPCRPDTQWPVAARTGMAAVATRMNWATGGPSRPVATPTADIGTRPPGPPWRRGMDVIELILGLHFLRFPVGQAYLCQDP
jgi:hypothetical protein